jgi:ATP-binding cassette subfamily C protein CydC
MIRTLFRLVKVASAFKWWMVLASILGFLTIGSSIGLVMTATYIVAKAALHPSIAELQVSIVGVRFFGIMRGVLRYFERVISHDVTFRLLTHFRTWFYKSIEPLKPAEMYTSVK